MKKLIVVTGGTKGIGKSIILTFAKHGFDIITCARNEDDLKTLAKDVRSANSNVEVFYQKADLSLREEVNKFVEYIKRMGRPIEVLVNNAGLYVPGQVHSEPEGNLEFMINTNLYSAYHLTRGLIHGMMEKKQGHIFNICSTASITPYVNGGSYCISKYAMLGMSKVLREEMKPHNIRVTSVLPGATFTASWEGVDVPEERFMKAEDIAHVVFSAYELSKNSVVEEILLRPQLGDLG